MKPCQACGSADLKPRFAREGWHFERCHQCGLERIEPQPNDAALSQIYGQAYYDAWGMDRNEAIARSVKLATFRNLLKPLRTLPAGAVVFDCGAATGYLLEVAQEMGLAAAGNEISEFGASKLAARFGSERVFQGSFMDLDVSRLNALGSQAVTMCDFLEHMRDPAASLERAAGMLPQGGLLCITTPDTSTLSHTLMGASWLHYKTEHLFYFNPGNLLLLLDAAGFDVLQLSRCWKRMSLAYVAAQMRAYPRRLVSCWFRFWNAVLPGVRSVLWPVTFGEMMLWAKKR